MTRDRFDSWNNSEYAQEVYPQDDAKLEEFLNSLEKLTEKRTN